jgi:hypothetical protein
LLLGNAAREVVSKLPLSSDSLRPPPTEHVAERELGLAEYVIAGSYPQAPFEHDSNKERASSVRRPAGQTKLEALIKRRRARALNHSCLLLDLVGSTEM